MKQAVNRLSVSIASVIISGIISTASGQNNNTANALTQLTEGHFAQARDLSAAAISANKNDLMAYAIHGRALLADAKTAQASPDFDKALRLNPNSGLIYAFKALVDKNQGNDAQTAQSFDKAIALLSAPQSALEYYARGTAYDYQKKAMLLWPIIPGHWN